MSNICDNIFSTCNLVLINIAWFAEQIFTDLNTIRKDIESCYDEDNSQIESQGRQRLKNAGLLKLFKSIKWFNGTVNTSSTSSRFIFSSKLVLTKPT